MPRNHPVEPDSGRSVLVRIAAHAAAAVLATGSLLAVGTGAASAAPPADPPTTKGPCKYTATPEDPSPRPISLPPDPRRTPNRGTATVVLKTNQGYIPLILDRAKAPCTVQSFLHLARHRFYDKTFCHRLTTYPTLKVLQCGDPKGNGEGGPGYSYKDELPTDLPPAPNDPTGQRRIYGRGLLAMANAGPNTNGSQFFMVNADSILRPNYTVFGRVAPSGMRVLDKVAAAGVKPTPEQPAPVDGAPALPVNIARAHRVC